MDAPMFHSNKFTTSCLVRQGLIPCSPFGPTLAIATRVLEMFRVARLRCPTLSIDSWVKTQSDLHGFAFRLYHTQQFTICYDLYLELRQRVHSRVQKALGRDAPDHRLKTACPACTYKLEGEADLIFSMLIMMDGNDSLKRMGTPKGGAAAGGNYYLSREKVDLWAKERLASLVNTSKDPEEANTCEEWWKNICGIFDETGVFVALCRHGFVLLLADMVRSGELAKYPLAIVDALLDVPLGPRAKEMNVKCLVGAFHGHAPNRKCQLQYLANYDLEGCEQLFSILNALARSVHYASVFHRRQTITTCLRHHDTFDTYVNRVSRFLVNNYNQAIDIIDSEDSLRYAMEQQGIQDVSEFPRRLALEMGMLKSLSHLPPAWTEKMEYYQVLVNLEARKAKFDEVFGETSTASKTARRHAQEGYDKAVDAIQEAETRLSIENRWTCSNPLWLEAETLVNRQKYHKCVNKLEELVLKRMFELMKMNMSQTGYKMRKRISKALQTQSKAIRTALKNYNNAASALDPPARTLEWDEVVDYTFLADFDLLRGGIQSNDLQPWATPAARVVLDSYFRIEWAKEEVLRLNIEIRRRVFFVAKEDEFKATNTSLAFAIHQY
ncbi:hypothetical protein C8J57DRAFT_1432084 [Mycena rebaudengoi]|nr:hypothetical protein C8J57DRAFT_1432084 [Mycena rebaudengoi]